MKQAENKKIEDNQVDAVSPVAKREEEILHFWQENKIFEKTLEQTKDGQAFVFYDGPPFANGEPHYGHILTGIIKDVIPRYQTMNGRLVRRRWGWDCHGLPVETLIEKELGFKAKKDIEEYGIAKFNQAARESVMRYADLWRTVVPRMGRWVDMDNDYRTMDSSYTETVLWIFKTLYDKGLIYEGHKIMYICPRCETTLSNFEVSQGYKDVTDISVTAKFELVDEPLSTSSGQARTFILAWTTTPWTLPGNVALAINPEIEYVKVKKDGAIYILAKARLENNFKEGFEIVGEVKGKDLIGKSYKPLFDYYTDDETLKNRERGWKIYGADFVTTEDGTGVVHIAPAFGEDDMELSQKENLPFIQHVAMDGYFKSEVKDWAGRLVKSKDDPQGTDVEVLKNLAGRGLLFAKEKIVHSYPHCWRCDTPLLNYATSSWFVAVTKIKDDLVKNNQTVSWAPANIRDGRFGKWLEGARDWAISRTRFWGAPLPVWRCEACKEIKVIGSQQELLAEVKTKGNHYFVMRHGEAENNLAGKINWDNKNVYHLTERGQAEALDAGQGLQDKKIDLIISSDLARTKETTEIVAKELGLVSDQIFFDPRLREFKVGQAEGGKWNEYNQDLYTKKDRWQTVTAGGESLLDVKKRTAELLYDLDNKYAGKNILLVSHGLPLFFLETATYGLSAREIDRLDRATIPWGEGFHYAEVRALPFAPLPHNENYDWDWHRPYIDEVKLTCSCGGEMKRVPDVFDCWFESGSMPYASHHHPFEHREIFDPQENKGFPADFIAEGLDQTRGWFYSMLVLSTALFGQSSFKQVVVNGLILAEDGQKMSKRLKNYPEPMVLVNKYGADALRFFLLSSPVVHAEDLNFSEKGVGEISRKIIARLNNVCSFYTMYAPDFKTAEIKTPSANVLDIWIMARLNELIKKIDEGMVNYELDKAVRPLDEFIDDLSNWYLRRSRERFKADDRADKMAATVTARRVLATLAKLLAPFMPFIAEEIYRLTGGPKESVHLESWPKPEVYDDKIIISMAEAREIVELGLAIRHDKGISVRQPLARLTVVGLAQKKSVPLAKIINDELNIKELAITEVAPAETADLALKTSGSLTVALDLNLTEELLTEGKMRELLRNIQDLRKKGGLAPGDLVTLEITTDESGVKLVKSFEAEIKKATNLKEIILVNGTGEIEIGGMKFGLEIAP